MVYAELFGWWIATISWSIAFPIVVSIYLYRRRIRRSAVQAGGKLRLFFFLGLLVFYIVTVSSSHKQSLDRDGTG
jgi:hypothetical protein